MFTPILTSAAPAWLAEHTTVPRAAAMMITIDLCMSSSRRMGRVQGRCHSRVQSCFAGHTGIVADGNRRHQYCAVLQTTAHHLTVSDRKRLRLDVGSE